MGCASLYGRLVKGHPLLQNEESISNCVCSRNDKDQRAFKSQQQRECPFDTSIDKNSVYLHFQGNADGFEHVLFVFFFFLQDNCVGIEKTNGEGGQPIVRRRTAQMDATSPMSPNVRSLGPSVGIDVSWSGTTTTAAFTTANTTSVNSNVSRPTCATNQKGASRCNNRSISERDCHKTNGRFKKRYVYLAMEETLEHGVR